MTIKGIIWDADGTLLDSMEIWDHAPDHYLETLGIEPEPNLGEILFEMSLEQGAKYLIDRYHLPVGVADVLEGIHCQIETFYSAAKLVQEKTGRTFIWKRRER